MSAARYVAILAQRHRCDANWCAVAMDALVPIAGTAHRAVCYWCADGLECAGLIGDRDAHRMNHDTNHDMGCCSFCGVDGCDVLVARVPDAVFDAPPRAFLDFRCAYSDRGGRLSALSGGPADEAICRRPGCGSSPIRSSTPG